MLRILALKFDSTVNKPSDVSESRGSISAVAFGTGGPCAVHHNDFEKKIQGMTLIIF